MAVATPRNIKFLTEAVQRLNTSGETFFTGALDLAFDFLQKAFLGDVKAEGSPK